MAAWECPRPNDFSSPDTPPATPPVPIAADYFTGTSRLRVYFDKPLDTDSVPTANNFRFDTGSGVFNGSGAVSVTTEWTEVTVNIVGGISLGATCDFTATGGPLLGDNGLQVVAFTDQPVEPV